MVSPDRTGDEGVEWFDGADNEQLADLYRAAWILCLPSSYEGFGRPYAEALAAGTPVVASPNPGAREVLEDGRYGVIARDAELGEALCALLEDADRRIELARHGLERARAFAWERVAERYEHIYDAALARRTPRRAS
jgi:glycosyltransferase involved in cell wall biosynthesis